MIFKNTPRDRATLCDMFHINAVREGQCICGVKLQHVIIDDFFHTVGFEHTEDCPLVLSGRCVQKSEYGDDIQFGCPHCEGDDSED